MQATSSGAPKCPYTRQVVLTAPCGVAMEYWVRYYVKSVRNISIHNPTPNITPGAVYGVAETPTNSNNDEEMP